MSRGVAKTYSEEQRCRATSDLFCFESGVGWGALGGVFSQMLVHEASHYLAASGLGLEPSFRADNGSFYISLQHSLSPLELGLVVGAGYAGNVAASLAGLKAGRKTSGSGLKGLSYSFSIWQGLSTLCAVFNEAKRFGERGINGFDACTDFTRLSDIGVPLAASLVSYLFPLGLVMLGTVKGLKDYYTDVIGRAGGLAQVLGQEKSF